MEGLKGLTASYVSDSQSPSCPRFLCLSISMASFSQFRYDHTFFPRFSEFQTSAMAAGGVGDGSDEESLVPNSAFENGGFDKAWGLESDCLSAALLPAPFPRQQHGKLDMLVPQFNMGGVYGIDDFTVSSGGYQPEPFQFGEDCCSFVLKMKPAYPFAGEKLVFQSHQIPIAEESNMKVCRYSEAERKERIVRYLKKRNQRNFNKTIKYACRKTLADRRVRVRGRFARNSEACDKETVDAKHDTRTTHHCPELYPCDDVPNIKQDEAWLQEMTNFMYFPYVSMAEQVDFAF